MSGPELTTGRTAGPVAGGPDPSGADLPAAGPDLPGPDLPGGESSGSGGDPVCWAHLVCPECGRIDGHAPGCATAGGPEPAR